MGSRMSVEAAESSAPTDRAPLALLALLISVPAFAVWPWSDEGGARFVLYRQPKEAAIGVLAWLFLVVFFWRQQVAGASPLMVVANTLRRWEVRILAAFLGWMACTAFWARVPENSLVELRQYLPLFLLLLVLVGWQERNPEVSRWIRLSLVLSLAGLTGMGLLQLFWEIAWLAPINPEIGAPNPSFMGYKNPMALALLGQIFLLAEMASGRRSERRSSWPGGSWPWRLLLALELGYLATLGSRTSLFALGAGALLLFVLTVGARRNDPHKSEDGVSARGAGLAWALAVVGVFVVVLGSHPVGRAKAESVLEYLSQPAKYLESDRGIYLLNTLEMVRHHPFGVGLGDWQTHYPVYRAVGRDVAFNETHQVRRAHSDPVQILGEGGWLGFFLWVALLGWPILRAMREGWRGDRGSRFASAQLLALAAAMSTDYLLDLPYGKLQLFLVLALAFAREGTSASGVQAQGIAADRWLRAGWKVALVLSLLLSVAFHASLLRRTLAAAAMQQGYQRWVSQGAEALPFLRQRIATYGPMFLASSAVTKTSYRDFVVLAHSAALLGHRPEAITLARRSLDLHPYYPQTYDLMAYLADDPEVARAWREARLYILEEARHGFDHPEPPALTSAATR